MNKATFTDKPPKKRKSILKRIMIVFICLELAGFLTAIGFYIAAMIAGINGYELASIGGSIIYTVAGSTMGLMIIGGVIAVFKGKIRMQPSSSPNINLSKGINITGNTSSYASPKKQVYNCKYCGYGTDTQIGKCPQCGGPIKES